MRGEVIYLFLNRCPASSPRCGLLCDSPLSGGYHPSLHDPTVPKGVVFKYNNGIYLCARPRQLSLQGCQVTITNFTKGGKKIFNTAVAETT